MRRGKVSGSGRESSACGRGNAVVLTTIADSFFLVGPNVSVYVVRLQRKKTMTSRQFVVAAVTSLVLMQLVAGRHLVPAARVDGGAGALCKLLGVLRQPMWRPVGVVRPPAWPAVGVVKRSSGHDDGHIRRLWLSRGSTSSLMNTQQLRQLLDSTDNIDLLRVRHQLHSCNNSFVTSYWYSLSSCVVR